MLSGTKNSIQDIMGMRFDEHIKFVFMDRHAYMASLWWFSAPVWEQLPADIRAAVTESARSLAAATREAAKQREAPALQSFVRKGGTADYATDEQRGQFRAATAPLRAWYVERYGSTWLDRVDQAVSQCELAGN